jgi:hypothetical protein
VEAPRLGSSCSPDGIFCQYASPCGVNLGLNVECRDSYWEIDTSHSLNGSCAIPICGH